MTSSGSTPTPDSVESALRRSPELLSVSSSTLLVVDVQEKLLPVIRAADRILNAIKFLLEAAQILHAPVVVSEQYPQGLGSTVPAISQHLNSACVFEKKRFSAAEGFLDLQQSRSNQSQDRVLPDEQVILVGIETHICVQQTALDLIAGGYRVFVVEDAVGSRNLQDSSTAIQRLRDAGVTVTTAESVAFEWCETAEHHDFRSLSRLVRDRAAALHAESTDSGSSGH